MQIYIILEERRQDREEKPRSREATLVVLVFKKECNFFHATKHAMYYKSHMVK